MAQMSSTRLLGHGDIYDKDIYDKIEVLKNSYTFGIFIGDNIEHTFSRA